MRTRYRHGVASLRTEAKQPSSRVMIASRAPNWTISRTAIVRSSSSLNSWPTSSSASRTFGETTSGSARTARRSGSPSASTTVVTESLWSSRSSSAYAPASTPAGGAGGGGRGELVGLAEPLGVRPRLHARRQRAGEDHEIRAAREVEQLVAEQLELLGRDAGSALVDLGLLTGRRVEDRKVGARLLADAHEVVEDRLLGELLDDPRARRAAREAGGDHRLAERLERARDVDALAARHRALLDRPVAAAEAEVGHAERPVDRRVQRDGDDHAASVPLRRRLRARRRRMARRRMSANCRVLTATTTMRTIVTQSPRKLRTRRARLALATGAVVTSGERPTTRPRRVTTTSPTRAPAASGPSSSSGTPVTRTTGRSPVRTTAVSARAAARSTWPSRYFSRGRATTAPRRTAVCAR